jgi:hypothetical protein
VHGISSRVLFEEQKEKENENGNLSETFTLKGVDHEAQIAPQEADDCQNPGVGGCPSPEDGDLAQD